MPVVGQATSESDQTEAYSAAAVWTRAVVSDDQLSGITDISVVEHGMMRKARGRVHVRGDRREIPMSVEWARHDDVSPVSNADRAYQLIRERLIMLDIRPSEPINDEGLARQLGFGRTPVREALKRLERDRLVVAYPRRGTFATTVDITDLAHISEIRQQLEPLVAARAARTAPLETRRQLAALAEEIA